MVALNIFIMLFIDYDYPFPEFLLISPNRNSVPIKESVTTCQSPLSLLGNLYSIFYLSICLF